MLQTKHYHNVYINICWIKRFLLSFLLLFWYRRATANCHTLLTKTEISRFDISTLLVSKLIEKRFTADFTWLTCMCSTTIIWSSRLPNDWSQPLISRAIQTAFVPLTRVPPTVMLECVVKCESQPLLPLHLTDRALVVGCCFAVGALFCRLVSASRKSNCLGAGVWNRTLSCLA